MKTQVTELYFNQTQLDCKHRRRRLLKQIGKQGIAILRSADQRKFSNDVNYIYRQDSNFSYLTGLNEDNVIAVLAPGCEHGNYLLFCKLGSEREIIWEGRRVSLRQAVQKFNADRAYPIEMFAEYLPYLLEGRKRLYCDTSDEAFFMQLTAACNKQTRVHTYPKTFTSIDSLLGEMRLFKSPLEVRLIKKAVQISIDAHRRAWMCCRPRMTEYEITAELLHEYSRHGSRPSYPPIVAAGRNACTLHYIKNAGVLKKGDLLLIDAGAEYHIYAADITRTIPVSGRFTDVQRDLYEVVLDAQKRAIACVKVGNTWQQVHRAAAKTITQGLIQIGLLRGTWQSLLKKRAYAEFFPHGVGHWLGLDVHDAGAYWVDGKPRRFEAGMLVTVEPGIYLRTDVPRPFRNIGIRIEDDVLVTNSGPKVLTDKLPKEVDAIEQAMAQ